MFLGYPVKSRSNYKLEFFLIAYDDDDDGNQSIKIASKCPNSVNIIHSVQPIEKAIKTM